MRPLTTKHLKNSEFEDLLQEADFFIEIKDIKKGDVVYEYDVSVGKNYEFQAVSDAHPHQNGWRCFLKDKTGEEFEIYVSGGTKSVYLPNFYKSPLFV